jgi:TonB family protein
LKEKGLTNDAQPEDSALRDEATIESEPVLSQPGELQEPWLRFRPKPERAPGAHQRHPKLVVLGILGGVLVVALVAWGVLFRPHGAEIATLVGDLKKLALGETSDAQQPSEVTTRKSTRRPRKVRDELTESHGPIAASPGGEASTLSQQPDPLQLEVQELSNERRLIQPHKGPVVRLREWGIEGRIHISGELPEKQEMPTYPPVALRNRVQGTVVLRALVGKNGRVQNVQVLSGPSILASAAVDAVRMWRYKPYYQDGVLVSAEKQITVEFTIPVK